MTKKIKRETVLSLFILNFKSKIPFALILTPYLLIGGCSHRYFIILALNWSYWLILYLNFELPFMLCRFKIQSPQIFQKLFFCSLLVLYQINFIFSRVFLVQVKGLEPIRSLNTRTSSVPVCQFQHTCIINKLYYSYCICQHLN